MQPGWSRYIFHSGQNNAEQEERTCEAVELSHSREGGSYHVTQLSLVTQEGVSRIPGRAKVTCPWPSES